jgi:predicted Fe-Mo cluster-binding NifX family protein
MRFHFNKPMRIIITSTGNSPDSKIDNHFGRCSYFVLYDNETRGMEFLPNPFKELEEGAGTSAVEFISPRNVNKIVTGELGSKVKPLLDRFKIQVIILQKTEKSVQEIITMLNH